MAQQTEEENMELGSKLLDMDALAASAKALGLIDESGNDVASSDQVKEASGDGTIIEGEQTIADPDAVETTSDVEETEESDEDKEARAKLEETADKTEDKTEEKVVEKAAEVIEKKADAPAPEANERDKDLEITGKTAEAIANSSPKTKKIIAQFKDSAKAARDERDTALAEIAKVKEAAKAGMLPEVQAEINQLRQIVREKDITSDPQIIKKYDQRIAANEASVLEVLKQNGLPDDLIATVKKNGINSKELAGYTKTLREAGELEAVEAINGALLENVKLSKEKKAEIEDFTKNYEARKSAEQQKSVSARESTVKETDTEIGKLAEEFKFLKQPEVIKATDSPAIMKAKQATIDTWNANKKLFTEVANTFDMSHGTTFKAAALGALVQKIVLPELKKQVTSQTTRIAELEAELSKYKKGSSIKPSARSTATETTEEAPAGSSVEDSILAAAKKLGIDKL